MFLEHDRVLLCILTKRTALLCCMIEFVSCVFVLGYLNNNCLVDVLFC